MAEKDSDSGNIKREKLDAISTCCICTEVYTDPKALPCIHTFCMKCIQATGLATNKGPGDEMPCPICRRLFTIPTDGFHGLPKNFFIERLIQIANVSDTSTVTRALCEACLEDNQAGTSKGIPVADKYCDDCKRKLCDECCNEHRTFKLTKNHKLIRINEYDGGLKVKTDLASSVCQLHEQNVLNVYCTDCKTVVCAICFIDDHKNHVGSHVNKFVDVFRKQITSNVEAVNEHISQAEMAKTKLLKLKVSIQERVENLECDVEKSKYELKQLADKHATSLLQDLCSIRQSKLKEIQMKTDDIDTYISNLETYISHCQNITAKGSASDICGAFSDLCTRAVELQEESPNLTEVEIELFNFWFRKSELGGFLEKNCDNLIGEIEVKGDSKPRTTDRQSGLAEQSHQTYFQIEKVESVRTGNESLLSANEQLRINIDQTNKMTIKTLEDNVGRLKQELVVKRQDSRNKLLKVKEKLKQEQNEKEQLMILYTGEIRRLLGELRYTSMLVLAQTIRTKAEEEMKKTISGLSILETTLFVVSEDSSEVEVYDLKTLSFSRRWNLMKLLDPVDISSCDINKCLYISDSKGSDDQMSQILRVDANGNLIQNWSTGDDYGCLSVTDELNVILTVHYKSKLNEYSPNGQLIREINLSSDASLCNPWHAIKLISGHFIISHGYFDDDPHRVCIVDTDGKLIKSFGQKPGSTISKMNIPFYLSVDENGFVMVADRVNSRVLLLNSDLEFKKEILSRNVNFEVQNPRRILLDKDSGLLLVADCKWDYLKNIFSDGRILIYDFK